MRGFGRVRPAVIVALLVVAVLQLVPPHSPAQGLMRSVIKERFAARARAGQRKFDSARIAGLEVAIWKPGSVSGRAPLVLFSHGFHGRNTQTVFLMQAMAEAGYLVVAPNHKDALGMGSGVSRPEERLGSPQRWSDKNYRDRAADITNLLNALHSDASWNNQIDWSRVALAGHSLGGYTMLGLAGAWPSWKIPEIKAVLALSPYCQPFVENGDLGNMRVPVMYQTGTRDLGICPFILRKNGAFDKTAAPSYVVVFDKASHFAWTGLNRRSDQRQLINYYSISFLDKFVKGDSNATPEARLSGVAKLEKK